MMKNVLIAAGVLWAALWAPLARADRVHLVSGAVIEGKATRQGDKVVVEVDSGELALPADEVQRVESSESDVQRADAMYARLGPHDAGGLVAFANFCRDHGMKGREQMALQRVIELAPDHAQARARLGYVRADGTWIKREEQLRAQGLVEYEGKWVTRAEMLQLERLRADAETARHARDKAQAEARKAASEAEQARVRAAETPVPAPESAAPATTTFVAPAFAEYAWPSAYATRPCARMRRGVCIDAEPLPPRERSTHPAFPIPGVKDPFDYLR